MLSYSRIVLLAAFAPWVAVAACSPDAVSSEQPQAEGGVTGPVIDAGGADGSTNDGPIGNETAPNGLSLVAGAISGLGLLDGVGADARFSRFSATAIDPVAKALFVPEAFLRRLDVDTRAVTTLFRSTVLNSCAAPCDDGPEGARAVGVAAIDPGRQKVYIAGDNRIRELDLATGTLTTIVGVRGAAVTRDGNGSSARFTGIGSMDIDRTAHRLYVTTSGETAIRIVDLTTNDVTTGWSTLPASGGAVVFDGDHGLFVSRETTVSVIDTNVADAVTTHVIAGVTEALGSLAYDAATKRLYAAERGPGTPPVAGIRVIDTTAWSATAVPGTKGMRVAGFAAWKGVAIAFRESEIFTVTPTGALTLAGLPPVFPGSADGTGDKARFNFTDGVAYDPTKKIAYVADKGNFTIRAIDLTSKKVTTIAGVEGARGSTDGPTGTNLFGGPRGLAFDPGANKLYVADGDNFAIRVVDTVTGNVSIAAGDPRKTAGTVDGPKGIARLRSPTSLVLDIPTHTLFFTDGGVNVGRRMIRALDTQSGEVRTITGDDLASEGVYLSGLAYDAVSKTLYVADNSSSLRRGSGVIYAVDIATGAKTAIAGTIDPIESRAVVDGDRATARFVRVTALAFDAVRRVLYVRDLRTVRTVNLGTGAVTTLVGSGERYGQRPDPFATAALRNEGSLTQIGDGDLLITDEHAVFRAKGF